jgi:hypothetical protein
MVTRRSDQPRSGCAINAAVEVIGDPWSPLVPRDVMVGNRRDFRILQAQVLAVVATPDLVRSCRGVAPSSA